MFWFRLERLLGLRLGFWVWVWFWGWAFLGLAVLLV